MPQQSARLELRVVCGPYAFSPLLPELAKCFLNYTPSKGREGKRELILSTRLTAPHHGKLVVRPMTAWLRSTSTSIQENQRIRQPARPRSFVVGCAFFYDHLQPLQPHSLLAQDGLQLLHVLHELRVVFGILGLA